MFNIRFVHYIVTALYWDSIILIDNDASQLMIDGEKKLFQNNHLHHFPKVNSLQS